MFDVVWYIACSFVVNIRNERANVLICKFKKKIERKTNKILLRMRMLYTTKIICKLVKRM